MMISDYYRILELPSNAGLNDVKKAFRLKAKQFHPDLNSSLNAQENFIRVHLAYEMILNHLLIRQHQRPVLSEEEEKERKRQQAAKRAEHFAKMKYEEFVKECEAYQQSPYKWVFQILYYGLFFIYLFCALLFVFVPLWAGWSGGIIYFLISLPLFVLAYFTFVMAYDWKKEIDPLFSGK
jgi:hypothetical protein